MSKKKQTVHSVSRGDVLTVGCIDCGKAFDLTVEEQDWYKEKGFALPKRCKECRKERRRKGWYYGNCS